MTLGSLFDGIAGFPLAAQSCGIEPLWASEIEPSCIEITKVHFPSMVHLGSVTAINGADIPPVDIISFGSPCQDLSIAGKQTGLDGERSGLFMEAVRIIREMRCATNGRYPAYAVWENVPGAYSSNKGEDFRRVLEALAESEIPMPQSGKWAESGLVRVSDRDIAWRTFDAQYWGVPQRRKRIYLVVDFRGRCAGEILFKPESLLGYTPQSGKEGKEPPTAAGGGTKSAAGNIVDRSKTAGANGVGAKADCSYTLNTVDRHAVAYCVDCRNLSTKRELYHTLQSKPGGGWSLNYLGCLLYRWIVRRLTPRECERLQGFPDDWTRYDTKGLEIKDSPRYRALGNSIAVPCAVRVFWGILSLE